MVLWLSLPLSFSIFFSDDLEICRPNLRLAIRDGSRFFAHVAAGNLNSPNGEFLCN
jgi:hypothetical protein